MSLSVLFIPTLAWSIEPASEARMHTLRLACTHTRTLSLTPVRTIAFYRCEYFSPLIFDKRAYSGACVRAWVCECARLCVPGHACTSSNTSHIAPANFIGVCFASADRTGWSSAYAHWCRIVVTSMHKSISDSCA